MTEPEQDINIESISNTDTVNKYDDKIIVTEKFNSTKCASLLIIFK
jgi:hypothetical protein